MATATSEYGGRTKQKKIAVVHVGPHKTGTTSIQSSTRIYKDAFRADGYLVVDFDPAAGLRNMTPGHLGRRPTQVIAYCSCRGPGPNATEEEIMMEAGAATPDCDEGHYRRIRDALSDESHLIRKWNLIFSMEDLDNPCVNVREVRDLLVPHYDVRVVVGYRRFFDWAASYYYQQHRVDRRIDGRRRGRGSSWPERNATLVNVRNWWTEERMLSQYHDRRYSTAVFRRYRDVFGDDKVSILNLHEEREGGAGGLVENFFCHQVPNAINACRAVRTRDPERDEKPNPNRGGSTTYDEVAVAAYLSGLVNGGGEDGDGGDAEGESDGGTTWVSRPDLREWIRFRQEDMLNMTAEDFPMDCGTSDDEDDDDPWLRLLLDLSLRAERSLAPTSLLGPHGEVELREEFKRASSSSKLCAVDTEAVLRDPGWIAFLRIASGRNNPSSSSPLPPRSVERQGGPSRSWFGSREDIGRSGLPFTSTDGRLPTVVMVMPVAIVSFFLGFVFATYFGRSLRRIRRRHGGGGKRGSSTPTVQARRSGSGT